MPLTDELRSYGAAHREAVPSVEHRSHKELNNRARSSHQSTRQRERVTKSCHSTGGAQRFLPAFSGTSPHLRPRRLMTTTHHRAETTVRFALRNRITGRHRSARHGLSTEPDLSCLTPDAPSGSHRVNNMTTPALPRTIASRAIKRQNHLQTAQSRSIRNT